MGRLTPKHRLRQLDPSLLVNGQTTSLLASETEKELVNDDRGGMICTYPFSLLPRNQQGPRAREQETACRDRGSVSLSCILLFPRRQPTRERLSGL